MARARWAARTCSSRLRRAASYCCSARTTSARRRSRSPLSARLPRGTEKVEADLPAGVVAPEDLGDALAQVAVDGRGEGVAAELDFLRPCPRGRCRPERRRHRGVGRTLRSACSSQGAGRRPRRVRDRATRGCGPRRPGRGRWTGGTGKSDGGSSTGRKRASPAGGRRPMSVARAIAGVAEGLLGVEQRPVAVRPGRPWRWPRPPVRRSRRGGGSRPASSKASARWVMMRWTVKSRPAA